MGRKWNPTTAWARVVLSADSVRPKVDGRRSHSDSSLVGQEVPSVSRIVLCILWHRHLLHPARRSPQWISEINSCADAPRRYATVKPICHLPTALDRNPTVPGHREGGGGGGGEGGGGGGWGGGGGGGGGVGGGGGGVGNAGREMGRRRVSRSVQVDAFDIDKNSHTFINNGEDAKLEGPSQVVSVGRRGLFPVGLTPTSGRTTIISTTATASEI